MATPSHTTIPTPNPSERSLLVTVQESTFANNPDILPAVGTRYGDCNKKLFAGDYNANFADYIYADQHGDHGLIFCKPKTDDDDPVTGKYAPFRTTTSYRLHGWDSVLKFLEIDADYVATRASAKLQSGSSGFYTAPEYYGRFGYIPGGSYGTKFVRYEYFAPTPFPIPLHKAPVPTSVNLMLPGRDPISFPSCLHPRFEIDRLVTSIEQVLGGQGAGSAASIGGQIFPSTAPFEGWNQYTVEHDQKQESGGWHCWKVVAYPPSEPDVTISESR